MPKDPPTRTNAKDSGILLARPRTSRGTTRGEPVSTTLDTLTTGEYKYGFVTDIESDVIPRGLNEDTIRLISAKKNEPPFILEWRLKAYRYWGKLAKSEAEPKWANVHYPPIDYQDVIYYAAPKQKKTLNSLEEVDEELLRTFDKL